MSDKPTSTEPIVVAMHDGTTGAADASNAKGNDENVESGSSRCSSPLQIPPSRLQSPQRPSLGVYFCPEEGERNDVLAALRVLRRQMKQTVEILRISRAPMTQTRDIASTLQLHDSQISQWLHVGCNVDPKKTISVKSLSIYEPMARYMSLVRDLEFDLPSPSAIEQRNRRGSILRRFSSSDSSRSNNITDTNNVTNIRLTLVSQRITASFQELKDAMEIFMKEEGKEKLFAEKMSRVRTELGIAHSLCLSGTRTRTLDTIRAWAASNDNTTPQILCLIGASGYGKSTIASTITCEWQNERKLHGAFFFFKGTTEAVNKSDTNRISHATVSRPRSTTAPTRRYSVASLSQLGQIFPPSSKLRKWTLPTVAVSSSSSNSGIIIRLKRAIDSCFSNEVPSEASLAKERRHNTPTSSGPIFLVIDSLDDLPTGEISQVVSRLREALSSNPQLRVLLTARTKSKETATTKGGDVAEEKSEGEGPWWAKSLTTSADETSLSPSRVLLSYISIERMSSSLASKDGNTSDNNNDAREEEADNDVETYVHSRMCFSLPISDQQRLVGATGGCIGTAVRLCDALEDAGSPERVLDVVLYREMVQRHGEHLRVVLV